ncbi:MAG: nucleoside recognition domain-containing protein [Rikenellaceae bacterium]|nr:nucleoside recognition domain-containing protein [Bacteroidales bacterium]
MEGTIGERTLKAIREVLPSTLKTCIWLVKITVLISLGILVLRYFNILPWFSQLISPFFNVFGLPGEAALAYVTGYFVNVYSAIAVIATLDLDTRAITILSVMVLCSHNMIIETAVQKKTGSSAVRIVVIRTLSAFILAFFLNLIMPGEVVSNVLHSQIDKVSLTEMLKDWFFSTLRVVLTMTVLIFSLSILQKILSEFGIIRWLSKIMRPFLAIFGLPAKTSFLWIVANTLGLAYGAAVMIEEYKSGKVTKKDIDLLNHHIAISHSNLEDIILLASVGGMLWWMLLSRWCMSLLLVWELRCEMAIRKKLVKFAA